MNYKPPHCYLFECYCVANKCLKNDSLSSCRSLDTMATTLVWFWKHISELKAFPSTCCYNNQEHGHFPPKGYCFHLNRFKEAQPSIRPMLPNMVSALTTYPHLTQVSMVILRSEIMMSSTQLQSLLCHPLPWVQISEVQDARTRHADQTVYRVALFTQTTSYSGHGWSLKCWHGACYGSHPSCKGSLSRPRVKWIYWTWNVFPGFHFTVRYFMGNVMPQCWQLCCKKSKAVSQAG